MVFALSIVLLVGVLFTRCLEEPKKNYNGQEIANAWTEMALYITRHTPANSPTFASRCFGYIGVTMYESMVHGYPDYISLGGQLNGLDKLPLPQQGVAYNWIVSLNAGQAEILRTIYIQTSDVNKNKIDSLESLFVSQFKDGGADAGIIERSIHYGRSIAAAIFEWSKTDGGHRGYLQNFDKTLVIPTAPGSWEPPLYGQSFSHYPLHPHWGKNRTFVKPNAELPSPKLVLYNKDSGSDYYSQFKRVYEKSQSLTQVEKETALWWGDDPSDTFTPPGHSYYLGLLVLRQTNADPIICAETYARIGMAVADAFINCWKWKYQFYSERPSSYISRNIDERWQSFWPDPPFPAFPSGHATQAAAAATVMIDMFGDEMNIVDSAHWGRSRDELRNVDFKPRTFKSFWQIAEETANSRFFGGIHCPMDNEVGLAEGSKMGKNVNLLKWKKSETYAKAKD
jgi:hypothetical protein